MWLVGTKQSQSHTNESRADTGPALSDRANESKGSQGGADWPKGTAWSGTGKGGLQLYRNEIITCV